MDAVDHTMQAPQGASFPVGMSLSIPEALLKRQRLYDLAFRGVTRMFASLVLAFLVGILISLLIGSWPAIKAFGPGFLVSHEWNPVTSEAMMPRSTTNTRNANTFVALRNTRSFRCCCLSKSSGILRTTADGR